MKDDCVVDIGLTKYADIHLKLKPGTNVAFANGMCHVMIKEGLIDEEYIAERTEGFEAFAKMVDEYTPEYVAEICGIDARDLVAAARMYATADKAPIIYCLGVTEHSSGTEGVMSMSNMALCCGKLGKSGCGVNPLRGQNNVQGACDMGASPNTFPGYQKVADPAVIEKFQKAWGVLLTPKSACSLPRCSMRPATASLRACLSSARTRCALIRTSSTSSTVSNPSISS